MEGSVADHVWSHVLAIVSDGPGAEAMASEALIKGGRSLPAALAHARHLALDAAQRDDATRAPEPVDSQGTDGTGRTADLAAFVTLLAGTRPAPERVVVDLDGRHGLDRTDAAEALGLTPAGLAERLAGAADAWDRELDPALFAWFGPGDCDAITTLLPPAPWSAETLVGAVGPIASHLFECETCGDRRRAMVSVRAAWTQRPLDTAPAEVKEAARRARLRRPAPAPPAIGMPALLVEARPVTEGSKERRTLSERTIRRLRRRPSRRSQQVMAVVAAIVGAAALLAVVFSGRGGEGRNGRVKDLTRLPAHGSALAVSPSIIRSGEGSVALTNTSAGVLRWTAKSAAPWVQVQPAAGRLAAGDTAILDVHILPSAPEGEIEATVSITGDDGSATATKLLTTIEHPPVITASVDGCRVTASADDEGTVASVLLLWTPVTGGIGLGAQRSVTMTAQGKGTYVASFPAGAGPLRWEVEATDARGNAASTAERTRPATACLDH